MLNQYTAPGLSLAERLWSRVHKTDGCWLWTGYADADDYGQFRFNYRKYAAHRVAYELTYGPIPDGLWVLHHCDTPRCCRPDHLWLGTNTENTADKVSKGRQAIGESNGAKRLSEAQVREIRRRHADGIPLRALGREFGVTKSAIWLIVQRKNWRHVA